MSFEDTYKLWAAQDHLSPELRADMTRLAKDDEAREDAFAVPMSFGTAGMRGTYGAGINRFNEYTVAQATAGLARYMDELGDDAKQAGVAISFDSRHNSEMFAHVAALVLGAVGIKTYVFDSLRPTPELSFAVRDLHAFAGIMITASHNPKQYNGYKLYGADGGQLPPEASDKITTYVRKVTDLFSIERANESDLRASGLMRLIGEDVDQDYLDNVATVTINHDLVKRVGATMKLVYTPLHGTGKFPVMRSLQRAGFANFSMVKEQAIYDPEFITVTHPNPEFPEAFDLSIQEGRRIGADLLIATDPDADRLGAAVRIGDDYHLLTGNQIASLLLHYILEAKKQAGTLPADGAVIKSFVSTELADKICADYGVEMITVETGFKFIGDAIAGFEQNHDHTFLFGFEESYGYLIKPFVRDKDAVQSTLLLAEVAAYYQEQGKTLADGLHDLYEQYGYFSERTTSLEFTGLTGPKKMAALMTKFREEAPTDFAGTAIERTEDYLSGQARTQAGDTTTLTLPQSDVLKYYLTDGTWIAIRPSGTEPKVKFYIGVQGDSEQAANAKLASYADALHAFAADAE
ncbi:phospho-sugar mutase [Lacticaseibacillus pantheris]|jgi:phosphoglucomutase|uniref:Phosphoglucomutase n=1 Tax=Lacticaseibacillus pantheris DSM 15945 = JCM 12539 = NBRC 106106 TaxID=1423783 RepID=A0A0R1U4X1_9LACO|nr:phospho-sugar mutase [Lacticaseibacillus pantheris]KRL86312.1 Phosphomannomutase [Lacticaseibacillus pantheris DSM 15945 = JCM 12539 = NBRC 106106]WKF85760.1 phospho-sugar mutase [Lacticaseibacillus pantheris]